MSFYLFICLFVCFFFSPVDILNLLFRFDKVCSILPKCCCIVVKYRRTTYEALGAIFERVPVQNGLKLYKMVQNCLFFTRQTSKLPVKMTGMTGPS